MWTWVFIAVQVAMSVVAFILMDIDKKKAQNGQWRIKEATLFLVCLLQGGIGGTLGMYAFRHKTKHWYFRLGFPLLAVVNTAVTVLLCYFVA